MKVCAECGAESDPENYSKTSGTRVYMERLTLCFTCAFWHELASDKRNKETVIAGRIYGVGPEPDLSRCYKSGLGFGGRRFDIEYSDGRKITTHNLWAGSAVPEKWRSVFPDTARFLGGAKEMQVGGTTCWNDSEPKHRIEVKL